MTGCSVIAVHLGGGPPCSNGKRMLFEDLCRKACNSALKLLQNGGCAVDAVCEAVRILEDSLYTNAGRGSNLTLCEEVECDASVMEGKTFHFGAVGALSGIRNPVLVAKALLQRQDGGLMSLGRVPPCFLVSEGARQWANENGMEAASNDWMRSQRALRIHQKHKLKLNDAVLTKVPKMDDRALNICDQPLDTVGAVCVDLNGNVASAASSGGLMLKQPGRVGQAAVFAAGCWAENVLEIKKDVEEPLAVAVVTTGVGESLIKTMLSRECAQSIKQSQDPGCALEEVFEHKLLKSPLLRDESERLAGALVLTHNRGVSEVLVAHTTASMCFAFGHQGKVTLQMSRLPPGTTPGTRVQIQGKIIKD